MEALLEEYAELQDKIEAVDGWDIERMVERAMDALRLPPADADVTHPLRRRAPPRRPLPSPPREARPAAARRADQPPRRRDRGLARAHLQEYAGTVVAVTHDRYFLDNVAGWILELDRGRGFPYKGNYTAWLEQKRKRLELEEKQESARQKRTLDRELEWVRSSPRARQAKSKARLAAYEKLVAEERERERPTPSRSASRPAAPGRPGHRGRRPHQGVRRPAADRGPVLHAPARRHRRHHRPERRRQDHPLPDDHRRGEARRRAI